MPLYREEGVVIRTRKLGEADRIVTLLTPGRGLLRAVAKGVRRTSSKFGARLEPFMVADFQCYEGRTLDTITQAETLASFGPAITAEYDRYRAASAMVETAERLGEEGDTAARQYHLLIGALRTVAGDLAPPQLARDGYLLRAMSLAGWTPGLEECVLCGRAGPHSHFAVQLGGAVCAECRPPGTPRLDPAAFELLGALLRGEWDRALTSAPRERDQVSGIVAAYTQWHLERGLRSLGTGSH
ncbi:DNA repair protein RecO [Leucobacter sp. GX24907]